MRKSLLFLILWLLAVFPDIEVNEAHECRYNDIPLYGRVKVVDAFPDLKVQIVDAFADLKVQKVEAFADACGEWQFVDSHPDFTIKFVSAFPEVKITYVDAFPGIISNEKWE